MTFEEGGFLRLGCGVCALNIMVLTQRQVVWCALWSPASSSEWGERRDRERDRRGRGGCRQFALKHTAPPCILHIKHLTNQKHYRTHTCKELIIMKNYHTLICIMIKNKNLQHFPETDAKENRFLQMWVPFAQAKHTTTLLGCLSDCLIAQGSVLRSSLTQLVGFDCWWFRLILDCLVLRSSSWTCCHSNKSVSLNLFRSRLISCKQD